MSRLSDALSEHSKGTWSDGFDQPLRCNTPDDYYTRSANIVDGDNRYAGYVILCSTMPSHWMSNSGNSCCFLLDLEDPGLHKMVRRLTHVFKMTHRTSHVLKMFQMRCVMRVNSFYCKFVSGT